MMTGLIVSLVCAIGYAAAYFTIGKGSGSGAKEKFELHLKSIQESESSLKKEIENSKSLVSAKQIAAVQAQMAALEASIAQERAQLAKVEATLGKSQQDVEQRENAHQNQKIAKLDEEEKLNQLLEKHESLAAESMQLEHSLAESMKNLDKLLEESEMTQSQRDLIKELQVGLEATGSRLRELISEYEAVKSRVEMLRQQHLDLEEEYTRLVELQLG
jgi:chromosome segregation ATPase